MDSFQARVVQDRPAGAGTSSGPNWEEGLAACHRSVHFLDLVVLGACRRTEQFDISEQHRHM